LGRILAPRLRLASAATGIAAATAGAAALRLRALRKSRKDHGEAPRGLIFRKSQRNPRSPQHRENHGARMTGMLEHEGPGLGHNKPSQEDADEIKHGKWERWSKKRTFVRALEGTYSHVYKQLIEEPRVYSSKDHAWKGGPAMYGKHVISPSAVNIVQSIESHIECYAPLNAGQKHGHLNSAVFYVLKGHGHDVHDGRHMKWEAGDVMLVENGCVHQHFNDDEKESCILLVFKAKPLFLFMHLLFQKMVEWPTDKLPPGVKEFHPPTDL
jgi:mannose-6-phosphate isomerase-like protein (cupin superfamily)